MTKQEREKIIDWAKDVSDEKLESEYYDLIYDASGSLVDRMYDLGYDTQDIIEREKYEKFLSQKCDLLEQLCHKRGIELWKHMNTQEK